MRTSGGAVDGGDGAKDDAAFDDAEAEDGPGRDSDSPHSSSLDEEEGSDDDGGIDVVEGAEALVDDHEPVPPAAPPEPPAAPPPIPPPPDPIVRRIVHNPVSGDVHVEENGKLGEKLGRISMIKAGTRGEAVSCYCKRHQCKVMKRSLVAPAHNEILKWYEDGLSVPEGNHQGLKTRHKNLFP